MLNFQLVQEMGYPRQDNVKLLIKANIENTLNIGTPNVI